MLLRLRIPFTSLQRGLTFDAEDHTGEYAAGNRELRELSENTAADVRKKAQMYSSWRAAMQHSHDEAVADLWTAQFFLPVTGISDPAICTTKDFLEFAVDKHKKPQQVAAATGGRTRAPVLPLALGVSRSLPDWWIRRSLRKSTMGTAGIS